MERLLSDGLTLNEATHGKHTWKNTRASKLSMHTRVGFIDQIFGWPNSVFGVAELCLSHPRHPICITDLWDDKAGL